MTIQYAFIGYSRAIMRDLDRLLPAGSVVIVEEPHVISARNVLEETRDIACVGSVVSAPTQSEAAIEQLGDIIGRPPHIRAVVPTVEYGVAAAAALAEAWKLPGATVRAARVLRNKLRLRETAAAEGIPQPHWSEVTGPDEVASFRDAHGGRCVLKPANRQASLGVQLLEATDDIESAWKHTVDADEPRIRARNLNDAQYIAEERLSGSEVSVEALVRNGTVVFLNITDKDVAGGRYPVELGHTVPAPLPEPMQERLRELTHSLVRGVGFSDGIVHAEWIVVDERPHLIECAGRMPGDYINTLIGLAYDCDVFEDLLNLLVKDRTELPERTVVRAASIRFLTAPAGTVTEVANENAPEAYEDLRIGVEIGDTVGELTNSWGRLGHVIATEKQPIAAADRARELLAKITISTEPALDHG